MYDRWVSKDGLVYRYNNVKDKLILCKSKTHNGYVRVYTKYGYKFVHRVVYETFVGDIPQGYQIDHINTIKTDNRLENLRCVTPKENNNNPLTLKHRSIASKNHSNETNKKISLSLSGRTKSEFGKKFFEHYKIKRKQDNLKLYNYEYRWYRSHNNKCSWEE